MSTEWNYSEKWSKDWKSISLFEVLDVEAIVHENQRKRIIFQPIRTLIRIRFSRLEVSSLQHNVSKGIRLIRSLTSGKGLALVNEYMGLWKKTFSFTCGTVAGYPLGGVWLRTSCFLFVVVHGAGWRVMFTWPLFCLYNLLYIPNNTPFLYTINI